MIIFCTTCKGRVQHLEETLPRNLDDNAGSADHKFVVLDYNSPDHLLEYLKDNHAPAIDSGRMVVYSFRSPGPFRMAHAKNMCHRLAIREGGDILVNLDADNFTGSGFADYVQRKFDDASPHEPIFLWSRMVKGDYARGISGRIAVSVKAFLLAGGYDEKYANWGPDDKDFNARLRRLGFTGVEVAPQYLDAVRHNDRMRFKEYKHAQTEAGEEAFTLANEDTTIANYGRTGIGMVYRNFDPVPITLGPIPTRVFGIGMHKTATTSLHHALQILGFDSAHWKSAHWAKHIYEEMTTLGRSKTLEKHYALCDLPIPMLYQALDLAYPGSKFILTIRDERKWLESVRNHWDENKNPFRSAWDTDAFTHRVHTLLYGRRTFDADVFIERYSRHNAEVREYFKDRPHDMMEMDMAASDVTKWALLCEFMDRPFEADIPYPSMFNTVEEQMAEEAGWI